LKSPLVSRVSASLLCIGGLALLFAPAVVFARLEPGFPAGAAWIGQLLGAAWLGLAALNWLSRSAILGGIYGRPVVVANFAVYFISCLAAVRAGQRAGFPAASWAVMVPAGVLAIVFGWLLFKGPVERDMPGRRDAGGAQGSRRCGVERTFTGDARWAGQ